MAFDERDEEDEDEDEEDDDSSSSSEDVQFDEMSSEGESAPTFESEYFSGLLREKRRDSMENTTGSSIDEHVTKLSFDNTNDEEEEEEEKYSKVRTESVRKVAKRSVSTMATPPLKVGT